MAHSARRTIPRMPKEDLVSSERAWKGQLVSLRVDEVRLASGRTARREVVEHPGAVGILAWDGRRVAMVRQWRHAAGEALLEIPAGTLDPGEEPLATARRELAEECSLTAASWVVGLSFFTAPGFCTERLSLYLATELAEVTVEPPEDEDLELSWMSIADALAAIEAGAIADAKSIAGLLWLSLRLGSGQARRLLRQPTDDDER
jgi:ADP-ribose pyrophosphatase